MCSLAWVYSAPIPERYRYSTARNRDDEWQENLAVMARQTPVQAANARRIPPWGTDFRSDFREDRRDICEESDHRDACSRLRRNYSEPPPSRHAVLE